ncbi:MAG: restriction endonuclease subunit S [Clostridiales bacterium]|nr:restriction endonuclease subunit S [Clostridiales bacterium]
MAKKKAEKASPFVPVEEQPYQVPENWCWVYLTNGFAECCDSFRKPINATERANLLGDVPYYGATGQVGWINDYLTEEQLVLLGEDGAPFLDMLKDKAYLIEGKAWVNNHAHILRSYYGNTGNLYLVHYLNCFDYKGYVNGTTRLKLTQANMNRIPIPLAPFFEQQRIVARIESLFAKLDETKEKVQEALESFEERQAAMLHKAFSGELTVSWRRMYDEFKDWNNKNIGDFCFVTKLAGFEYTDTIAPNLTKNGIPLFKGKNVQKGKLVLEFESFIPKSVSDGLERSKLSRKCLLTPYVGTIGNIAIFDGSFEAHLGSNVGKIEVNSDTTEEYLLYYLRSDFGYAELTKKKKATAQESISIQAIRDVSVKLPSMAEQAEIVRILDDFFAKEAEAKAKVEATLDAIDSMKKSILAKAFRGELGTNNPEDESAEELLKRTLE